MYGLGLYRVDSHARRFINHNRKVWSKFRTTGADRPLILVDLFRPAEGQIVYSYFLNILAKRTNSKIMVFTTGFPYFNMPLWSVYESFNTEGYVRPELSTDQLQRRDALVAEAREGIHSKNNLFDYEMSGVWCGIDIYEAYLRVHNKPTADLDDANLWKMVSHAAAAIVFWNDYFDDNKVAALVCSHDCYIYPGLICKLAYQRKIPVYLPSLRAIYLADKPHSTTLPVYRNYPAMFAQLSRAEQENARRLAKEQLERRFKGEVGVDMAYSTKSAYHHDFSETPVLRKSDKVKILIASHCFFDNPHGCGEMLFVDFYEWLCFLGRMSERTDYDWYIKTHPGPLPGTDEIIRCVLEKYPKIAMIPPNTSHHQLVKEGIRFVLTVFGSVGHEYPALGAQVITAGGNPRMAYDINWHARSLEEYEQMLSNVDTLNRQVDLERLYEFYYMHHYYVIADDLFMESYRKFTLAPPVSGSDSQAVYSYFMDSLTDDRHRKIVDKIEGFLASGKHWYFSRGPE